MTKPSHGPARNLLEKEEAPVAFAFVGAIADRDHLQVSPGEAIFSKAEFFGRARSEIKMAARNKRASIIDFDNERLTGFKVGDFDQAW